MTPPTSAGAVDDVLVVGAGAAGLAVVRELLVAGIRPRVIDAGPRVGQSWRTRHDSLRLNTHRSFSALPGMRFPRSTGAFPHRDDVVTYLEDYLQGLGVPVEWDVSVQRVDPAPGGWSVHTSAGRLLAPDVVLATGPDAVPVRPHWPGGATFRGELRHAADVRRLDELAGKRVLIVGAGNSGVDLASALTHVHVDTLWVSARHGVTVVPRRLAGLPMHPLAVASRHLPVWFQDASTRMLSTLAFGDLGRLGLPAAVVGAKTLHMTRGVSPATDDGFIAALRRGDMQVVPEVTRLSAGGVHLVDGTCISPDVVICATGYRTGLEPVVGHLGVLDEVGRPRSVAAPVPDKAGLWFVGQRPPFHGNLYARGREARALVRAIEARRANDTARPPQTSPPGQAAFPCEATS